MPIYARDALEMTAVWLLLVTRYQRWSRGHKARGQFQGQGHKKSPRPRTSLSEDRPSQGQGHSASVLQKKGLQKIFLGDLQFIGIPRSFDWGDLNHNSHVMTSSKIFQTGSFCGTKIS